MDDYGLDRWTVDAPLTGVCVERSGRYGAFAGGDGCVRIVALLDREPSLVVWSLTQGAVLALTPDCRAPGFLCGADDSAVYQLHAEDGPQELAVLAPSWPDRMVTHPCGLRAIGDGLQVRLLDAEGGPVRVVGEHPSTVAGLAFDDSGERLAASHYNGVSLWTVDGRSHEPQRLFHRGSHLTLTWSRNDRYVVTATQENTIHAWDLVSGQDVSLGPCISKVKSLSWSADGAWLLGSGADTVSGWPFSDGRLPPAAPRMLGRFSEDLINKVCSHPSLALAAVGYNDGGLELVSLAMLPQRRRLVSAPSSPIVELKWSPDGDHLLGGDLNGSLFVYRFDTNSLRHLARGD